MQTIQSIIHRLEASVHSASYIALINSLRGIAKDSALSADVMTIFHPLPPSRLPLHERQRLAIADALKADQEKQDALAIESAIESARDARDNPPFSIARSDGKPINAIELRLVSWLAFNTIKNL